MAGVTHSSVNCLLFHLCVNHYTNRLFWNVTGRRIGVTLSRPSASSSHWLNSLWSASLQNSSSNTLWQNVAIHATVVSRLHRHRVFETWLRASHHSQRQSGRTRRLMLLFLVNAAMTHPNEAFSSRHTGNTSARVIFIISPDSDSCSHQNIQIQSWQRHTCSLHRHSVCPIPFLLVSNWTPRKQIFWPSNGTNIPKTTSKIDVKSNKSSVFVLLLLIHVCRSCFLLFTSVFWRSDTRVGLFFKNKC